jgi:hypothetical protein
MNDRIKSAASFRGIGALLTGSIKIPSQTASIGASNAVTKGGTGFPIHKIIAKRSREKDSLPVAPPAAPNGRRQSEKKKAKRAKRREKSFLFADFIVLELSLSNRFPCLYLYAGTASLIGPVNRLQQNYWFSQGSRRIILLQKKIKMNHYHILYGLLRKNQTIFLVVFLNFILVKEHIRDSIDNRVNMLTAIANHISIINSGLQKGRKGKR